MATVSSSEEYFTEQSSGAMKSLMEEPLGYDKWWIKRNCPGAFLGTTPRGETRRLGMGGASKGPATLPASHSFLIFSARTPDKTLADFKLLQSVASLLPVYGIWKPSKKPFAKNIATAR